MTTNTRNTKNTSTVARSLGVPKQALLSAMQEEGMIERTANRHYKANPMLVRAGYATSGDLQWTPKGVKLIKQAYASV